MDAADNWFGDEGDFGFQVDQQPVAQGEGEFEGHYGDHLDNDNNGNENSDIDIDLGLDNSQEINGELAEEDWDNHDNLDNDSVLSDSEEDDPFGYRDLPLEPEEEGTESEEEEHYHINRPPRHLQQSPHSPQSPSSSESSLVDADPGFDIDLDLPYDVDHDFSLGIPGFYNSDNFQSDAGLDQDNENADDNNNNNNNEEDEDRNQDSEDNENTSSDNDSDNDSDPSLDRRLREQFDIFEASARIEARLDELEQRRQLFVQGLNEARQQFESIAEQQNRREQNRHYPYRVPALLDRRRTQQAQQQQGGGGVLGSGASEGAGPAAALRGQDLAVNELDELVEMEVGWPAGQGGGDTGGQSNNNSNPAHVVIDLTSDLEESPVQHRGEIRRPGRSIGRRTAPVTPEDRAALLAARRARREMSANNANNNNNNGGPAQAGNGFPEVIDLTLDDDDPAPAAGPAAGHHHNNRRRGNVERSRRPVNRRPASNELIVDLGEVDSDDDDAIARAAHRSAARNAAARPPAAARAARANAAAAGGGGGGVGGFIATLLRMRGFAGVPAVAADLEVQLLGLEANNPLGQNLPNFDYGNNGRNGRAAAAAAAAAAAEAQRNANEPPPAREGFTRATGDDLAVVCPSCEEELAYDPDEEEQQKAGGPPAKRPRNKKDREEHFFWAVKECGHVYCKKCFENRKCTKNTGFKAKDQGSSSASGAAGSSAAPAAKQKVIVCAVEDCSAEVGYKGHWVGLFL